MLLLEGVHWNWRALVAGDFLQGLREKGSARGRGNNLLWKDFKPNPRLVTKCRLRGSVSVPAAHLHPQPGLAEGAGAAGAWARAGGTSVLELRAPSQGRKGNTLQVGRNLLLAQAGRGMEGEASSGA